MVDHQVLVFTGVAALLTVTPGAVPGAVLLGFGVRLAFEDRR